MNNSTFETPCVAFIHLFPNHVASIQVRPNIASLEPYRCARDDYSEGILLDANENSIGPTLTEEDARELNRYPCPYQKELKTLIAEYRFIPLLNCYPCPYPKELEALIAK